MHDIHVILKNSPGSLGLLGSVLGKNGVGLEGVAYLQHRKADMHTFWLKTVIKRARY